MFYSIRYRILSPIIDLDDIGGGDFPDGSSIDDLQDNDIDLGMWGKHHISDISFCAKEDMLPVEEIFNESNLLSLYQDPFGVYAISHNATHGLCINDFLEKPVFGNIVSEVELQNFCNQAFDALHLKHIPVNISSGVANAAYSPGLIPRMSFDDALYINPNYASYCIDEIGSTDIVLSDLAHEIGHYVSHMTGGPSNTYESEKIADFVSGFLNAKFGVDVDVARKWFQLFYDPDGRGGYPVSEERWDIEAAGYHFGQHATFDDLKSALKDKHFLNIIKEYNSTSSEQLASVERLNLMQTHDETSVNVLNALGMNNHKARVVIANIIRTFRRL